MQKDDKLEGILYYFIEKANKVIRRHSQEKLLQAGFDITVDQWLVMKKIKENERISQVELADALFKDTASITRILNLLANKKLIKKEVGADKRIYELSLTDNGQKFLDRTLPVVKGLRKKGIEGLSEDEVETLKALLSKVIQNMS